MSSSVSTADLCDDFGKVCGSCTIQFKQYGGRRQFSGRIRTIRCLGDNALLRKTLGTPTHGEVLVVDGGGHLGSALMGDRIGGMAVDNGWEGVVIFGAVRDSIALGALQFGVKALGTNPQRSAEEGRGELDVTVAFGGVAFTPGHMLYSDEDGILVTAAPLEPRRMEMSAASNRLVGVGEVEAK